MIKFNDNSIYVGYIKQLLKDFNLPNCQVYREELKDFYNSENTHLAYIKDNAVFRDDKVVSTYNFNDKITNITNNLHITSNIYDSKTHKYLGEYLRFIRDYTGLDLMQMYNCFTNESPVNVHIDGFDSNDDNYQLFILPIKFNRIYTIGIDCFSCVSLRACHYENKDLVDNSYNVKYSAQYESGARFNKPFIFKSPEVESTEQLAEEKTLKLLIKIPFSCKSSIVVLEGDYRRGCDLLLDNNKQILASTATSNLFDFDKCISNDDLHIKELYKVDELSITHRIEFNSAVLWEDDAGLTIRNSNYFTFVIENDDSRYVYNNVLAFKTFTNITTNERQISLSTSSGIVNIEIVQSNKYYIEHFNSSYVIFARLDAGEGAEPNILMYDTYEFFSKLVKSNLLNKTLLNIYNTETNSNNLINYYISKPQLLYLNTQSCYLLADRLCEYLSKNVIDSNEEIMYNIRLVQKAIHSEDFSNSYVDDYIDADDKTKEKLRYNPIYYGMWDDKIRESLYNFDYKYKNTYNRESLLNNNFDMLGYYDKDTEYGMQYLVDEDEINFEV